MIFLQNRIMKKKAFLGNWLTFFKKRIFEVPKVKVHTNQRLN